MASLQFEGDLVGLNERQQQFIREVIERQGFTDNKVLFEALGKTGDNYGSQVKRITIVNNGTDDIKIIVKIAPNEGKIRDISSAFLFSNEILMYEEVLPKLVSLQKSIDVPENERLKFAKCYGCLSEQPNELILLEDLAQSGYAILDRFVPLEGDAVKAILKNLAILHSLSFVLKNLEPETFENYGSKLTDNMGMFYENDDFKSFFEQAEKSAVEVLEDENQKRIVHNVFSQWRNLHKMIKKHANPKNFVIQQGDSWTNNIMFQIKDGEIADCIIIDYQISKATNPTNDLLYMIFICTDHNSRLKHFHEWMDYYHVELDKSLSNFGLKASLIYSRDQLDADLKRYSKLAFCTAVMVCGIITRSDQEAAITKDVMKSDDFEALGANMGVSSLSKDTIAIYRSRISDMVDSCRQFGYVA